LDSDYAIYEIAVPVNWYGKSIVEMAVRNRYKVSILATKKNGKIQPLPHQDHIFSPDETLMVMGDAESVKAITR